jgi:hypothetical protein
MTRRPKRGMKVKGIESAIPYDRKPAIAVGNWDRNSRVAMSFKMQLVCPLHSSSDRWIA